MGGEVHVGDGPGDGLAAALGGGAAGVEDRGEVVEVLPDGEVVVDGGRLRDVADAGAESGVARGVAEDVEGAGDVGLGADDGAHQGGLSAAGGAEEAGDAAAGDVEGDGVEDRTAAAAGAAADGEAVGADGGGRLVIHHVMNNAPGCATAQGSRWWGRAGWGRAGSGRARGRGRPVAGATSCAWGGGRPGCRCGSRGGGRTRRRRARTRCGAASRRGPRRSSAGSTR